MNRIERRRHGREQSSLHAIGATHVIKIGFDARAKGADKPFPGKLAGFLICRDTLGPRNERLTDHEAMIALGKQFTPEAIERAKKGQLKAPPGLLPTELQFVLMHDAIHAGGQWTFPGTFSESYERWGKEGLLCHGNGAMAMHRQRDATKKEIKCVPIGATGALANEFCQYSKSGACGAHSRLLLCLWVEGPEDKPTALSKAYGWQARFRFDTGSENHAPRVLAELDMAAARLDGRISGLTGLLSYGIQRKRTGNPDAPVGIVGQVQFSLCEAGIREREEKMFARRLEEQRVLLLPGPAESDATPPEHPESGDPFAANGVDVAEELPPGAGATTTDSVEPEPPGPEPGADESGPTVRKVADASDEELAAALSAFAREHVGDYAYFDYDGKHNGKPCKKTFHVPYIDWFFEGKTEAKDTLRRQHLRDTCQRLEDSPSSLFALIPTEEELAR